MSLSKNIGLIGVFGVVALSNFGYYKYSSVERGEDFLASKGYTDVTGGTFDLFNTCGKSVFARNFDTIDKNGKSKNITVCYGLLRGPFRSPASFL